MTPSHSASETAEHFYEGALARIRRFMLVLGAVGIVVCLVAFPWAASVGFAIGGGISYVNHRWLERMVDALGQRITTGQSTERGGFLVLRALLRYVSIAVAAYAIFKVSKAGLFGFLGGVCLPIAAIACEAAVELFVGLRREV